MQAIEGEFNSQLATFASSLRRGLDRLLPVHQPRLGVQPVEGEGRAASGLLRERGQRLLSGK